jgi:WD40 repeat protein
VSLWREDGGELRRFELEHPQGLGRGYCGFSSDDRWLLTSGPDGLVRFWRTIDGTLERTVLAPKGAGKLVAVSPNALIGIWVRFEPATDFLVLLDLASGQETGESRSLSGVVNRAEFSPDGTRLALGDNMGPVTILEVPSGRSSVSGIKHSSNLHWVEWSPDVHRLLTTGNNAEVLVCDATTGTEPLVVLRMPSFIGFARWSPDGRFIVTRSETRQVRVWDAATGEAVTPLLQHNGDVRTAFMTEKSRLITTSEPDLVRAWDLNPTLLSADVLADYAKLISGRFLNDNGAMLVLKPKQLAELCRSLRVRAPQMFE